MLFMSRIRLLQKLQNTPSIKIERDSITQINTFLNKKIHKLYGKTTPTAQHLTARLGHQRSGFPSKSVQTLLDGEIESGGESSGC